MVSRRQTPRATPLGPHPRPRGAFPTQALLCTDQQAAPEQIVAWFVLRWQLEVTFHEVRDHLGVETQRQWSELAIRRVTPALLGLFSFVTLLAHDQIAAGARPVPVRQVACSHGKWPVLLSSC